MAGREVQRLEVVPVVFHLGAVEHGVAEADEDVLERAPRVRDGMEMAAPVVAPEGRQVEALALGGTGARLGLERGASRVDGVAHRGFGRAERLAQERAPSGAAVLAALPGRAERLAGGAADAAERGAAQTLAAIKKRIKDVDAADRARRSASWST